MNRNKIESADRSFHLTVFPWNFAYQITPLNDWERPRLSLAKISRWIDFLEFASSVWLEMRTSGKTNVISLIFRIFSRDHWINGKTSIWEIKNVYFKTESSYKMRCNKITVKIIESISQQVFKGNTREWLLVCLTDTVNWFKLHNSDTHT